MSHDSASKYRLTPLSREKIPAALPLVRMQFPSVAMPGWERFAISLTDDAAPDESAGGIVTAERNGYIRGLFAYHCLPGLGSRSVMLVQMVIMAETISPEPLCAAMRKAMIAMAGRLGCDEIHVLLRCSDRWAKRSLAGADGRIKVHCDA